jgi:S1-C subfamily serine protease
MRWRSSARIRFRAAVAVVVLAAAAVGFTPRSAEAALGTGVVDVTTVLGYQNASAAGTGIVLTASGEVLTNNHIIRGATTIRVTDPSTGRSYPATVAGYSVTSDVAVLQLSGAPHLRAVALGNSSTVKLGQRVTAVGNAGGVGGRPSSAAGRVTGLARSIVASDGQGHSERLVGLIRTNAALQPGDSGGPLLNSAGRVVGMDTAASAGFEFQSASEAFAIPINYAINLAKQIEAGRASATVHIGSTPMLGVSVSFATSESVPGALVAGVVAGSPADQAGIVIGDTITTLDGQPIVSYDVLSTLLLRHNAGDTVTVGWVDQNGAAQTANVQTAAGPPQ